MGCSGSKIEKCASEVTLEAEPWKLIHSTTIDDWMAEQARMLQFDVSLELTQKKTWLQPWCTGGKLFDVFLPSPMDKQELDVQYLYNEMLVSGSRSWFDQRIPLNMSYRPFLFNKMKHSPFLESAQVIGHRDNMAVIEIVRADKILEFLFVDLSSSRIMGKYTEEYVDAPYLLEAYISPDLSCFLLKPNLLFALKFRIQSFEDALKVISDDNEEKTFQVTSKLFKDTALDLILTFDPRYRHTQIAIGNLTKRGQHVVCMYNIKQRKITQKTYGPQYQRSQNLVFTPDGEYLAALLVTHILGPNMYPQRYNFIGVMIYNTKDLSLVHKLTSYGTNSIPYLTPAALFPVFSKLGDFMIMGSGNGTEVNKIDVYRMPRTLDLQNLCRIVINRHFSMMQIKEMPLANLLIDYLLYKPTMD